MCGGSKSRRLKVYIVLCDELELRRQVRKEETAQRVVSSRKGVSVAGAAGRSRGDRRAIAAETAAA